MWVTVDKYHYNADHIVEFQWDDGRLYICDDAPVMENIIKNVCVFEDPDRKKYVSICNQLGIKPLKDLEE